MVETTINKISSQFVDEWQTDCFFC